MEVMRNMTIDTELFELGDIISFTLTTGEKVKAKAIRETPNGMLFITVDCLKDEQRMFENPGRAEKVDYEHSDLRKKLNGEIFESFPEEIKGRMVGMRVGQTNCFDMVCKCGGKEFFTEEHGNQTGLYCSACGKWQKWLKKDEIRLFNHGVKVENASLLERLKARIEESAIKVSTVKAPHTYMKAVGTRELEKILEEELENEDTK